MALTQHYDLDVDTSLGGADASDYVIPSQKAIKSYVDNNTGYTVDQIFDGTSTNAQSGVAIDGELSSNYQSKLVSGSNIKTINNTSLLGSGNIDTNEIFIAEYNETTYAEILQAYNDDKNIFVRYSEDDIYFLIPFLAIDKYNNQEAYFCYNVNENSATISVDSSNNWSVANTTLQTKLVSGSSIKTINNTNILGSGNISVGTVTSVNNTQPDVNGNVSLTIPTVNNPTITFTQGGTTKGTITLNQSSNQTIAFDAGGSIVVDQTYDGTSTNAQSGVAIAGELSKYVKLNGGSTSQTISLSSGTGTTPLTLKSKSSSSCYVSYNANGTWVGSLGVNSSKRPTFYNGTSYTLAYTSEIPAAQVNSDWDAVSGVAQILNKPSLGTMASESASDYTPTSGLATVATTGDYDDLINKPTIPSISNLADTDLSNLSTTGKAVIDGQWVSSYQGIISSNTSLNSSTPLLKRIELPNDGHDYEVLLRGTVITGSTVGNFVYLTCNGTNSIISSSTYITGCTTRAAGAVYSVGSGIITAKYVASTGTNLSITRSTGYNGNCSELTVIAYRRIGTNA